MKIKSLETEIEIPQNVEVKIHNGIHVKGPKGEVFRPLKDPKIKVEQKDNKIIIGTKKVSKKEKRLVNSFDAHIRNMLKGVTEEIVYKLKICSGHFPMTAGVENSAFVVKNFFGERIPRVLKLKKGVDIKVDGEIVIVKGVDLELVSQTAANIEQLCRIVKRDRRIFQDGIYIIEKDGEAIE